MRLTDKGSDGANGTHSLFHANATTNIGSVGLIYSIVERLKSDYRKSTVGRHTLRSIRKSCLYYGPLVIGDDLQAFGPLFLHVRRIILVDGYWHLSSPQLNVGSRS